MDLKPLTPEAVARLRRELTAIDLQLEVELASIRVARIESRLEQLSAMQRQHRRLAQSAAAEHARQVRQQRMAAGLGIALFGGAAALYGAVSSHRPRLGLRDLD